MATESKSSGDKSTITRPKRLRYGPLPKPPVLIEVPYGQERAALKDLSCGQLTQIVLDTPAFRDEIGVILDKLDAKRGRPGGKRGIQPLYTALECETVFLYQRVCGLLSIKEARDRLAGDRAEDARRLFDFNRERETNPNRARKLRVGIPSEATLCRHRQRFGERRRRGAYERFFRRLAIEHMIEFPEMQEEARILGLDGTTIKTHYTCPKYAVSGKGRNKKKRLVNGAKVTCPEGGYVGLKAGADKSGHGFNAVILTTMTGLPLGYEITRLNDPEAEAGAKVLERFGQDLRGLSDVDALHVLAADGAYHSNPLRKAAREAGLVERIHLVSHGDAKRSRQRAEQFDRIRQAIDGYPNWTANGHLELSCKCGQGHVWKEIEMRRSKRAAGAAAGVAGAGGRNGSVGGRKVVVRTGGNCKRCGRISITAGTWRRANNVGANKVKGFKRVVTGDGRQPDMAFGNPLTFHDQLSEIYGKKRFGNGEGLHGALVSRFGLNKGKRWFRRRDQVLTDTAMVFSIIHALAIEQRRRARAGAGGAAGSSGMAGLGGATRACGPPG
jgi:hypothetical protein